MLHSNIFKDHIERIKNGKYIKIPLWTLRDGKRGKLRRSCTIDFKILQIHKFVRHNLLGYRRFQRLRPEDIGAHEMHIGFSKEEQDRMFDSKNPLFVNRFPLVEMGLERKDNYKYVLEEWGMATKASACTICPYHKNYFYQDLQTSDPVEYAKALQFDEVLRNKPDFSPVKGDLFLTYSCKRLCDLTPEDCNDAQTFDYRGQLIWNGF